jgi:hypothetical protein
MISGDYADNGDDERLAILEAFSEYELVVQELDEL